MLGDEARQLLDFQRILKENPYDIDTRKVFADWLEERGLDDEALEQRSWSKDKYNAEMWLNDFALRVGMTYEQLLKNGDEIASGEFCFNDDDAPETMREYWSEFIENWQILTGKKVDTNEDDLYFRCAC